MQHHIQKLAIQHDHITSYCTYWKLTTAYIYTPSIHPMPSYQHPPMRIRTPPLYKDHPLYPAIEAAMHHRHQHTHLSLSSTSSSHSCPLCTTTPSIQLATSYPDPPHCTITTSLYTILPVILFFFLLGIMC